MPTKILGHEWGFSVEAPSSQNLTNTSEMRPDMLTLRFELSTVNQALCGNSTFPPKK